jgi:hypothetical protein
MKRLRKFLALTLALVSVLILCVAPVQAWPPRTTAESFETCDLSTVQGSITTRGGMTFWRDVTLTCYYTSDDPRARGVGYSTINANLDANGNGPAWGTCYFVSDEGGIWPGRWHQQWTATSRTGKGVAPGEGIYQGQTAILTFNNPQITWEFLETGR